MPIRTRSSRSSVVVALLVLALTAATPARAALLELVEGQQEGINGVTGLAGVLAVVVSADGKNVYTAGANDNAVDAFSRDPATGTLTLLQVVKDGVDGVDGLVFASSLALSPDGAHLYVTSNDNALAVFRRDAYTGALTFVEAQKEGVAGVDGLHFARSVVVSADGSFVYVAGQLDGAIAVFRRNAMTGWLTFVEAQREGISGVDGVAGPLDMALSPDGKNLYVASGDNSALTVFARNASTGRLHLANVKIEDIRDIGLSGVHSVTVSADGAYVYAAGQSDDAVAVFRRDKRSGGLTFVGVVSESIDGVDGIYGALSVTLSPDGTKLYVTGTYDNAVAAFERNTRTGALSFLEMSTGSATSRCLAFARGAAVSPDGRNLYVAAASSNTLAVFRVATP